MLYLLLWIALISTGHALLHQQPSYMQWQEKRIDASRMLAVPAIKAEMVPERDTLPVLERLSRSARFYSRVIPILARYKAKEIELERRCASEEECLIEYEELDDWGSSLLRDTILELQGFYVKSGQVISTRVDLFARPYTEKLSILQDGITAIDAETVKSIVRQELGIDSLDEIFSEFDDEPLGAASIAQVHAAKLKHTGQTVAVKVQRPGARALLLADVANLKRFSKLLASALPVDYYVVFSELGEALEGELDFFKEAQSMEKLRAAVALKPGSEDLQNEPSPVRIPLPIPGLCSRKVLVMEFIEGTPLSRLREQSRFDPNSPEAKLAGTKIVTSLGDAYARMVFNGGHVHADPHPGNIFISENLDIALLDCGQTKQLALADRAQFREVILKLQTYRRDPKNPKTLRDLADEIRQFGVKLKPREELVDASSSALSEDHMSPYSQEEDEDNCLASIALLLFGDKTNELPGGYDSDELSPNSPLRRLALFPQSLVLVGRAAVLIRGIAARLNVPYSLADAWEEAARASASAPDTLPPWVSTSPTFGMQGRAAYATEAGPTTRELIRTLRHWARAKSRALSRRTISLLPGRTKTWLAARAVRNFERKQLRQKQQQQAAAISSSSP